MSETTLRLAFRRAGYRSPRGGEPGASGPNRVATFAPARQFALPKRCRPHAACGELNAHARLTWKIARAIRAEAAEGEKHARIAWYFGVNRGTVHKIVYNKQWVERR